jgi:hypothetical protein
MKDPLPYVEATAATLVALWLVAGLLAHPAAFGAVALVVLLPLALVALPLLGVHAFGDRTVSVRRLPSVDVPDGSLRPGRGFPSDD